VLLLTQKDLDLNVILLYNFNLILNEYLQINKLEVVKIRINKVLQLTSDLSASIYSHFCNNSLIFQKESLHLGRWDNPQPNYSEPTPDHTIVSEMGKNPNQVNDTAPELLMEL
jgi:hypothetical protein